MGVEAQQRGEQFVEVGATDGDPVLVAKLGLCVEAQLFDAHGSNSSVNRGGSDYAHTFNADAPGVEVSLNMRIGRNAFFCSCASKAGAGLHSIY
jgi:hypothetical protein